LRRRKRVLQQRLLLCAAVACLGLFAFALGRSCSFFALGCVVIDGYFVQLFRHGVRHTGCSLDCRDVTDFDVTDAARAAEEVEAAFRATGVTVSADVLLAEEVGRAALTLVVLIGSSEPLPVTFFPPVVFTIAIAFYRLCLENKTAENLLL
jgi:hypothetical protein